MQGFLRQMLLFALREEQEEGEEKKPRDRSQQSRAAAGDLTLSILMCSEGQGSTSRSLSRALSRDCEMSKSSAEQ